MLLAARVRPVVSRQHRSTSRRCAGSSTTGRTDAAGASQCCAHARRCRCGLQTPCLLPAFVSATVTLAPKLQLAEFPLHTTVAASSGAFGHRGRSFSGVVVRNGNSEQRGGRVPWCVPLSGHPRGTSAPVVAGSAGGLFPLRDSGTRERRRLVEEAAC